MIINEYRYERQSLLPATAGEISRDFEQSKLAKTSKGSG